MWQDSPENTTLAVTLAMWQDTPESTILCSLPFYAPQSPLRPSPLLIYFCHNHFHKLTPGPSSTPASLLGKGRGLHHVLPLLPMPPAFTPITDHPLPSSLSSSLQAPLDNLPLELATRFLLTSPPLCRHSFTAPLTLLLAIPARTWLAPQPSPG